MIAQIDHIWQKYSVTHRNHWVQLFQSLSWPQIYNNQQPGMQAVNIFKTMGHSQELTEF